MPELIQEQMASLDRLIVHEDATSREDFLPLTYTRPVASLRTGMFTGLERLHVAHPSAKLFLQAEPLALAAVQAEGSDVATTLPPDDTPLVDACILLCPANQWPELIRSSSARPTTKNASATATSERRTPSALWELLHHNAETLLHDLPLFLDSHPNVKQLHADAYRGVQMVGDVYASSSVAIGLGAILDGSVGPIVLDDDVKILPGAILIGPLYVGRGSMIKAGAKIYGGTSIGPMCKIGGEVENSIVQGYSNKQHDGYLGHSYLGEWCNLGADTNTSDLKNDYSNVRVIIEGKSRETESKFVGVLMGDHSKTAINTQFNTGTAVGVCCNIFHPGFPPKWIPNFTWGGGDGSSLYRLDKALAVAEIVMQRRGRALSDAERTLLSELHHAVQRVAV